MTDSVLFIMGSLMLAVAVVKQQLDKRIAYAIVRLTGTRTINVCFGISVVSGLLASFIGEHTVAAMMPGRHYIDPTDIRRHTESARPRRRLAVLDRLWLFGRRDRHTIRRRAKRDYGRLLEGVLLRPDQPRERGASWSIMSLGWPTPIRCFCCNCRSSPWSCCLRSGRNTATSRGPSKLRSQVAQQGPMRSSDWVAIMFFGLILFGWISQSSEYGMGTIAIVGACLFLIAGLVQWEDVNSGVNWGVVLLYAAAISLGVQMKDTGAAQWMAKNFLAFLTPIGAEDGIGLWAAISMLTTAVTNTMSNGAAVAVLGPFVLKVAVAAGESRLSLASLPQFPPPLPI